MPTDVRYYRCPQCKAIVHAADLGTPWAGAGWLDATGGAIHWCRATSESDPDCYGYAESLSELPREAVLSC